MAMRRMISMKIVESDAFLDMPISSQALYFHLCMYADDEGFVNPKRVMRMIGAVEDDIKILLTKRFILSFESGVVVIKHWLVHNSIRMDRFNETVYLEEKKSLSLKENGSYTDQWQPNGNQMAGQVKLSKVKLSKDKLSKGKVVASKARNDINPLIKKFEEVNPTTNYGNKTQRKALELLVDKFGLEKTSRMIDFAMSVQGKTYAPTITTPHQLKEKLSQLMIYYEKESGKSDKFKIGKI